MAHAARAGRVVVGEVADHAQPLGVAAQLVDRAEEVEEAALEAVTRQSQRVEPAVDGHVDRQRSEPFVDDGVVSEC